MSEKCKTLTMPFGAANFGEGQFCENDVFAFEEFLAGPSPSFEFGEASAGDGKNIHRVAAVVDGGAQPAPEMARRLAAIARIEIVCGPAELIQCRQRIAAAWSRVLERQLVPLATGYRGWLLRRSNMAAMLEFKSTLAAVRWAIDAQGLLERQTAGLPEPTLGVRIDIDAGEFVDAVACWQGPGDSAVASTACSRRAGEIWVTRKAHAFVVDDIEFQAPAEARSDTESRLYQVQRPRL